MLEQVHLQVELSSRGLHGKVNQHSIGNFYFNIWPFVSMVECSALHHFYSFLVEFLYLPNFHSIHFYVDALVDAWKPSGMCSPPSTFWQYAKMRLDNNLHISTCGHLRPISFLESRG